MWSRSNNLSSGFSSSSSPPELFSFTFRFQLDSRLKWEVIIPFHPLSPNGLSTKVNDLFGLPSEHSTMQTNLPSWGCWWRNFYLPSHLLSLLFGCRWMMNGKLSLLASFEDFFMFSFYIVPRGKRATSGIRLLLNALSVLWDCRAAFTYQFWRKIPPRVSIFVLCQHASTKRLFYVCRSFSSRRVTWTIQIFNDDSVPLRHNELLIDHMKWK